MEIYGTDCGGCIPANRNVTRSNSTSVDYTLPLNVYYYYYYYYTTNKKMFICFFFLSYHWSCVKKSNNNNNVINKHKLLGRLCALQIIAKHDYERFPLIIK